QGAQVAFYAGPGGGTAAKIAKVSSKPPIAAALPPISDPSAIPKNSALLFQASTVPDCCGKSLASPACWAGKNSCATAELKAKANSTPTPPRSQSQSRRNPPQSPESLPPVMILGPSRSAIRPPISAPAI